MVIPRLLWVRVAFHRFIVSLKWIFLDLEQEEMYAELVFTNTWPGQQIHGSTHWHFGCWCVHPQLLSHVWLFVTQRTIAHPALLSMEVPRQECWSGLPFPSPGDLPNPEIEPKSPTLTSRFLTTKLPGKPLWLLVEKPWHGCVWRMQTQVCRAACRFPGTCVLFVFHQCSCSKFLLDWDEVFLWPYLGFPGSLWWTGRPGMLQFMGSQRVRHDWVTELNWTVAQLVKNLPAMQETWVRSLVWEDFLDKGKATHSSILAWRIPWTV